jgi:hypothetical protein
MLFFVLSLSGALLLGMLTGACVSAKWERVKQRRRASSDQHDDVVYWN